MSFAPCCLPYNCYDAKTEIIPFFFTEVNSLQVKKNQQKNLYLCDA